jgi:hypothetical protein
LKPTPNDGSIKNLPGPGWTFTGMGITGSMELFCVAAGAIKATHNKKSKQAVRARALFIRFPVVFISVRLTCRFLRLS